MPAEVSEHDIERERQTLRDLRRRSISSPGPGALAVDPDLPPPSPTNRLSFETSSYSSNDDVTLATPDGLDDGSLFWVPAHLHPELAPGEFRAFLKSHTHPDPEHPDALGATEAGLGRSSSWLARRDSRKSMNDGGLGRSRSMLSRQYHPKAGDQVEEEAPPLPDRRRESIYRGSRGDQGLTLEDLQKLEMMMDEAEKSEDPEDMRHLLRRSLSMNHRPGFLQDDIPQNEGDAPPPRPGSIIRRANRTKIRKSHLPGDGGGRRFAATRRRGPAAQSQEGGEGSQRKSSDDSSESATRESADSHDHEEKYHDAPQHLEERRASDGSTDEAVIFDAYRQSRTSSISSESAEQSRSPSPEGSPPRQTIALPHIVPSTSGSDWFQEGEKTPTQESVRDPLSGFRRPSPGAEMEGRPGLHLPSGMSLQVPVETIKAPSSPTSPTSPTSRISPQVELPPGMAPPINRTATPPGIAMQHQNTSEASLDSRPPMARTDSASPTPSIASKEKEKEKEKKGGFFSKKDKDKKDSKKKEKEGFLGGLFGSKKKVEEVSSVANFSSQGPAAAAALLGSSRTARSVAPSPTPSPNTPNFNAYARYPIHVERAVYRLSHIKLANARRPLYEQVLISNLMFWYLGVIGRNVAEEKKANVEEKKDPEAATPAVKPPAKGTPPKPADTGSAGTITRQAEAPAPREKKVGLSKPERARDGRNNEAPVRPPQYGMQHAQVDSELRQAHKNAARTSGSQYPSHPPGAAPPFQQQQPQRAVSNPGPPPGQGQSGPSRVASPPMNGQRPNSEAYPNQIHVQGPPRGVPQSSFGPPPPTNGPFDDRMRTRTMSTPVPPPGGAAAIAPGQMRRVVTDGRPPDNRSPSSPKHAGPQPGQIFQYPGGAPQSPFPPRAQPGQIFNGPPPQPGQVFQHPPPQFNGQPAYRPVPEGANPHRVNPNGPPVPGQPGWQQQQQPGRLPPQQMSPNPGMRMLPRPEFDPRAQPPPPQQQPPLQFHQHPQGPPRAGYPYSPQQGVPGPGSPQLGHPIHQRPPQQMIPPQQGQGQGFYSRPPPSQQPVQLQPGQVFNPYAGGGQPVPEGYRRPQPVPGQFGQHHR